MKYFSAVSVCDGQKQEWVSVILEKGDEPIAVKVVRTQPLRNRLGQPLNELKSIRRAFAHHRAGYVGSLQCKLHEGVKGGCKFCVRGVARFVCGDCHEPLPMCACLRNDPTQVRCKKLEEEHAAHDA